MLPHAVNVLPHGPHLLLATNIILHLCLLLLQAPRVLKYRPAAVMLKQDCMMHILCIERRP